MESFLRDIAFSVIASAVVASIIKPLKQPLIIGYIIAGIIIGPQIGLGIIHAPQNIELISEIGLIFLLFIIGTELKLSDIIENGKNIIIVSISQIGLGFLIIYLITQKINPIGFSSLERFYLAFLLNLSSTLIVVKMLKDKFETQTFAGKITIGVLIFQDLVATLFLVFQKNFLNPNLMEFVRSVFSTLLLLSFSYLLSRYLFLKIISKNSTSVEFTLLISIAYCFFISSLASSIGVSKEMGALIAGFSIGNSPYSHQIVIKISSIRDFFVTLFFVSLGLKMPQINTNTVFLSMILIAIIIIVRIFTTVIPFFILKTGIRPLFITSLNLFPISEFSLVVCAVALENSQISNQLSTLILITMLISSILSGYLINYSHNIYSKLALLSGIEKIDEALSTTKENPKDEELTDVLVLGFNAMAFELIRALKAKKPFIKIVVADFNAANSQTLMKLDVKWIYADLSNYSSIKNLEKLNPKFIFSTMTNIILKGTDTLTLFINIKSIFPKAKIVFITETDDEQLKLLEAGAKVINKSKIISQHFLREIIYTERKNNRSKPTQHNTTQL